MGLIKKIDLFRSIVILFIVGIAMFCGSCRERKADPHSICKDFIQLNRSKKFDNLYDVSIGVGRVKNDYDETVNRYDLVFTNISVYNDSLKGYVKIPVFKRDAISEEIDSVYRSMEPQTKRFVEAKFNNSSDSSIKEKYVDYIIMIYEEYYDIETPKNYSGKNVVVEGNPDLGKFITFTLTEKIKIYYVSDTSSLNSYWKNYFEKVNKGAENWFYEITN